ncbi:hypothetical protein [Devosia sp. 2618]|uniref:DUF6950 family protein n=1 Tax=Devosia sp. 2618 TaxID=3156454 RepID=UPI003397DE95
MATATIAPGQIQIDFFNKALGRTFQWGEEDCSMFLANWWRHVHAVDPARWLRGTYRDAIEADIVVMANRGLQRLVARIASEAGAVRTRAPTFGDFGLVVVGGKPFGAVSCCPMVPSNSWVIRTESGLVMVHKPRMLRTWSINFPN